MPNQTELEQQFKQAVEAYYELPTSLMDLYRREGEQVYMATIRPLIEEAEQRIMDARCQISEWFPDHPATKAICLDTYYLNRNHPGIWEVLREELDSESREGLETDEAYNEALQEFRGS